MTRLGNNSNREIDVWNRHKIPDAILGHAREMRRSPTDAEQLLWEELRGKKLDKLKFRRQQPMQGYILDFYCEEIRLGVEVDGEIHLGVEQKKYDQQRSEYLAEYEIKIIRFTNDQVSSNMKEVLNLIKVAADQIRIA
jgi:very-short-patch-repair endonuclease